MARKCLLPAAADPGLFYRNDRYTCGVDVQENQGYIVAGDAFLTGKIPGKKALTGEK